MLQKTFTILALALAIGTNVWLSPSKTEMADSLDPDSTVVESADSDVALRDEVAVDPPDPDKDLGEVDPPDPDRDLGEVDPPDPDRDLGEVDPPDPDKDLGEVDPPDPDLGLIDADPPEPDITP